MLEGVLDQLRVSVGIGDDEGALVILLHDRSSNGVSTSVAGGRPVSARPRAQFCSGGLTGEHGELQQIVLEGEAGPESGLRLHPQVGSQVYSGACQRVGRDKFREEA